MHTRYGPSAAERRAVDAMFTARRRMGGKAEPHGGVLQLQPHKVVVGWL